jgi:hypothetical protein
MVKRTLTALCCIILSFLMGTIPVIAAPSDNVAASFDVQGDISVTVTTGAGTINPHSTSVSVDVAVNMGTGVELTSLDTITFKAYYDADGSTDFAEFNGQAANTNNCGVIIWTNGTPGTFVLTAGAGNTWIQGTCVQPTLTAEQGTFQFLFTPGYVTRETATSGGQWQFAAYAVDGTFNGFDYDDSGADVTSYLQVDAPASITWGAISPPLAFADNVQSQRALGTITVISNDSYALQLRSTTSSWGTGSTLNTNGTLAANEFGLRADDDSTVLGATTLTTTLQTIYNSGTLTDDDGIGISIINVWLGLHGTFPSGNFSGTIEVMGIET